MGSNEAARAESGPASPGPYGEVLFTFDDGPKVETTPRVLEELDRRGIKAVFFVNGWKFERDPRAQEVLRKVHESGHYVGNHTYSHKVLCRHLALAPFEIDRNQQLIWELLGFRPDLLRTPYGQRCRALKKIVAERGFQQIGWNIDAQEWRGDRGAAQIAKHIIHRLNRLRGRAIILMHDSREKTVQALPRILDWLAQHPSIKVVDWRILERQQQPPQKTL